MDLKPFASFSLPLIEKDQKQPHHKYHYLASATIQNSLSSRSHLFVEIDDFIQWPYWPLNSIDSHSHPLADCPQS